MREKVLQDTEISSIHAMGELTRAQELRVDEFFVRKLTETHDTIQRLFTNAGIPRTDQFYQ